MKFSDAHLIRRVRSLLLSKVSAVLAAAAVCPLVADFSSAAAAPLDCRVAATAPSPMTAPCIPTLLQKPQSALVNDTLLQTFARYICRTRATRLKPMHCLQRLQYCNDIANICRPVRSSHAAKPRASHHCSRAGGCVRLLLTPWGNWNIRQCRVHHSCSADSVTRKLCSPSCHHAPSS